MGKNDDIFIPEDAEEFVEEETFTASEKQAELASVISQSEVKAEEISNVESEEPVEDVTEDVNEPVAEPASNKTVDAGSETVIGNGCVINGDISTEGNVYVNGEIKGKLICKMNAEINGGCVEGDIHAGKLLISNAKITSDVFCDNLNLLKDAKINGTITAEDMCMIEKNSVCVGDIKAKTIVVNGAIKGDITADTVTVNGIVQGNISGKKLHMSDKAKVNGVVSFVSDIDEGVFE
jgi:cytoskeletal protein CcmA (bactofilin family)